MIDAFLLDVKLSTENKIKGYFKIFYKESLFLLRKAYIASEEDLFRFLKK